MKTAFVYGGIINLHTGKEFIWNGQRTSMKQAVAALRSLPGTKYGMDWTYAGDCGLAEGNIFVVETNDGKDTDFKFYGSQAVKKFLAKFLPETTAQVAAPKATQREVVTQQVTFSKGDVRAVRFVATKRQVTVRCKGLPRLVVRAHADSHKKADGYEAFIKNAAGTEDFVLGSTPEAAYKRAVRQLWAV